MENQKIGNGLLRLANMYVDANTQKDAMKIKAIRVRSEAWKARKLEMDC